MSPAIEKDLEVTTPDGEVLYLRKYVGTPEFYVYDEDGEQDGWGMKDDAFMDFLVGLGEFEASPVNHSDTPMGSK